MSTWKFDGYTKVKVGSGRRARFIETHIYKCILCGQSIRIDRAEKPPMYCPHCGARMDGGVNDAAD